MGLDPILLLEGPPPSENYTVHIIRPGEDINKILDSKIQEIKQYIEY